MNASRNPWTTTSARADARQEVLGARSRLDLAVAVRPEHDPRHLEVGSRTRSARGWCRRSRSRRRPHGSRSPAGVEAASRRRKDEREHQAGLGSRSARRPTLRQGARPDSCSASSRCRSLIVSIGPKKPSYRECHDLTTRNQAARTSPRRARPRARSNRAAPCGRRRSRR